MKKPKLRLERGPSKSVPPADDPDLPNTVEKPSKEGSVPATPTSKERRPKTDKPADTEDGLDDETLSAA